MDAVLVDDTPVESVELSYNEDIAYEEQLPDKRERASLADRIGRAKVYLLSDATALRGLKVRGHGTPEDKPPAGESDADAEMTEEDSIYRGNALLFQGPPLSHLPTDRIFAYATHFDATPMGLEWVNDTTCVLVFETNSEAENASRLLQKNPDESPDDEGFIAARTVPMTFWPPEQRINASLGKGEGLKGPVRMRWALVSDVKKKGARQDSQFYRKHGKDAGKLGEKRGGADADEEDSPTKRRRRNEPDPLLRAQLDDELDSFLREDSPNDAPPSPPSKMRSDYIADDGKSLLQRTSDIRPESLASRVTARLPRRGRRRRGQEDAADVRVQISKESVRGDRRDTGGRRREPRPRKTQQELDDELEAFLRPS
ncbi:hypothetical protein FA95DRAFT_1582693 [Auriscalpium vulgare]|uniref:Uncharacterized protein n=1 Tax=Auriscalpium vulgare TaxID=40419 RepID=A0ACB8RSL1_9AGAM|nr:hypothetical protein FA95DRAFT_1582693 [Auriscalpium vulgare]